MMVVGAGMGSERILLVEDERIIAIDLQRRLAKFGFMVCGIASGGREAIEMARETRPDIILMDVMLSGAIDGIEAAKAIRQTHDIPVIFLTAYSDEVTFERAKEAEPFAFILKPFKEKELHTTIDIALYKHRVDRELRKKEGWLSAILNGVGEGIIATDVDSRVQFMNSVAEEITGWSESDARNRPLHEIVTLSSGQPLVSVEAAEPFGARRERSVAFEDTLCRTKDGTTIQIAGSLSRMKDPAGRIDGQVIALRDTTIVKRLAETVDYQASHDPLTGLDNREYFSRRLGALIEDAQRGGATHALVYLDLDQFKVINDTCGHVAGDELLRQTTAILKTVVRSGDACGRLGSDEFGILLENSTLERAEAIAKRLQAGISDHKFIWDKKIFSIGSSIGLVMITKDRKDIYSALAAADDASYVAKELGGNRVRVYEDTESVFLQRRGEMEWISKLKRAVEENGFRLYYQAIVPIQDPGKRHQCEVLLRLLDDGKVVHPADFLPAAERYNLMPEIDRWVISKTIDAYCQIRERGESALRDYVFCINLSGASLADESSLGFIESRFERAGVPPSSFCFEVTETAAIGNVASASRFISELKGLGFSFALDDFGSGFSSFNYLKNLPVDYLKIDGSFVRDIVDDPINRSMVEAINGLGKLMNIQTIAEFVVSGESLEKLRGIGVDYVQGYHTGAPAPLPYEPLA